MSDTPKKPGLSQLIDEAQHDVLQKNAATAALANQPVKASKTQGMVGGILMVIFAVVAVVQAPRIKEPFVWPDASASPAAAEMDLETVVGVVETYRVSQGRYPQSLSDIRLPDGLANVIEGTRLEYTPSDTGYALAWTLPKWIASYQSQSGKIMVVAVTKP